MEFCHVIGGEILEIFQSSRDRDGIRTTCTLQCALAVTLDAADRHHANAVSFGAGAPSTIRSTLLLLANSSSVTAGSALSAAAEIRWLRMRAEFPEVSVKMRVHGAFAEVAR